MHVKNSAGTSFYNNATIANRPRRKSMPSSTKLRFEVLVWRIQISWFELDRVLVRDSEIQLASITVKNAYKNS